MRQRFDVTFRLTGRRLMVALVSCLAWLPLPHVTHADETTGLSDGALALAGRVLRPDGTLQEDAVVIVRSGKISRVDDAANVENLPVRRLGPEAVIWPGMIDLFALPGAVGQTVANVEVVDPDASPAGVLDPGHRDFRTALESGITAVLVGPSETNLVCGVCVTTRTRALDGQLDIVRDNGPLILAFGEGVWRPDRAPTSRIGALGDLRELLAQARDGAAPPRVNAAVAGELDAWITCSTQQDVLAMHQLLGDARNRFGMIHTQDAIDVVDALRNLRGPVVMGPYSMESSRRVLMGAVALSEAGVEIAFRAGFPQAAPEALRLSAALAVRHGMDPAAARRAITSAPAKVAGVADRLGSIMPGKEADLVIFSRDPLRMDARVLEVFVRGERVYSAAHQKPSLAGGQP